MKAGFDRCVDCTREFPAAARQRRCRSCQAADDRAFAPVPSMPDLPPWKYCPAAMQERLSVSGKADE